RQIQRQRAQQRGSPSSDSRRNSLQVASFRRFLCCVFVRMVGAAAQSITLNEPCAAHRRPGGLCTPLPPLLSTSSFTLAHSTAPGIERKEERRRLDCVQNPRVHWPRWGPAGREAICLFRLLQRLVRRGFGTRYRPAASLFRLHPFEDEQELVVVEV